MRGTLPRAEVKAQRGSSEGPQASGSDRLGGNPGSAQPQCAEDLRRKTWTATLGPSLRLTLPLTGLQTASKHSTFTPSAVRGEEPRAAGLTLVPSASLFLVLSPSCKLFCVAHHLPVSSRTISHDSRGRRGRLHVRELS